MSWHGPALSEDQRDLAGMLAALAADRDLVLTDELPDQIGALAGELAELGVWTLGASVATGGGGADAATVAVALEQLGRHWPALGWAATQANAALDVIAADSRFTELCELIHTRAAGLAVVDAASLSARLDWSENRLAGSVARIDAAHTAPHLLVLVGDDEALLVAPEAITTTPVRRTGLGGSLTVSLDVDATGDAVREIHGAAVGSARRRLRLGAAAVAAGIAGAAADDALRYASDRRQFGDVLTAVPTVRSSLLSQASRVALMDLIVYAAAEDDLLALAVAREACAGAIDTCAAALQSHGGYGYITEYAAERRLRDAVSLRAAADVDGGAAPAAQVLVGLAAEPTFTKEA